MGKQEILDALTDEWQTAQQLSKKLKQRVSTPIKKLRDCGEINFRYIRKGSHWRYEYKLY
jgi:hypothetical protein